MNSKFAIITFLDPSGHPDHELPGIPPGYWGGVAPPVPTHPIAPGGGPSQGPGFPTHPIAPGGPPVGIWPSPGHPSHPIAPGGPPPSAGHLPVFPPVGPDNTLPPTPGEPPQVALPIVLPDPIRDDALFELKWSPLYGWVLVPIKDEEPPSAQPKKK
jgi:hypothetical protein